jgi:hypothetical protein
MTTRTRAEAIATAAAALAEGRRQRDTLPVPEAARLAYTPTGPSLPELEERIAALRGHRAHDAAAA